MQEATQWLVEWLEEVADEPWTDKDFKHRWKLVAQIARPTTALKEALMEPVVQKMEEREAAMAAYAAGVKRACAEGVAEEEGRREEGQGPP